MLAADPVAGGLRALDWLRRPDPAQFRGPTLDRPWVPGWRRDHISSPKLAGGASRRVSHPWWHILPERAAATADDATLIDMTDVLCAGDVCPAVLGGFIVLREVFHLTAAFLASPTDELEPTLGRLAGG